MQRGKFCPFAPRLQIGFDEKSTPRPHLTESPEDGSGQAARSGRWSLSRAGEGEFSSPACDGCARYRAALVHYLYASAQGSACKGRATQGGPTKAMLSSLAGVSGQGRELFVAATEGKNLTNE